jgi:hypothetical protein
VETRSEFKQTLLFSTAIQIDETMSIDGDSAYAIDTSFSIGGSISSFVIKVNMFSNYGKYAFASKEIVSTMPFYADITMPPTIGRGDKEDVPVSIVNDSYDRQFFHLKIKASGVNKGGDTVTEGEEFMEDYILVRPKARRTIQYSLDTSKLLGGSVEKVKVYAELLKEDEVNYNDFKIEDKIEKMSLLK